ncbi:MAG: hypothetical protein ABSC51_01210 [Gaiellaceae bacterium]
MDTAIEVKEVRLRPPYEALRHLTKQIPSDRAIGRMLGAGNHAIADWRNETRRMRKKQATLVAYLDAVVEMLTSIGIDSRDLEYVLAQPWDVLDSKSPTDVLKEGELQPVLKAVPEMFGELTKEHEMTDWKEAAHRELRESVAAALAQRPLHESFVFLHRMPAEEVQSFAEKARFMLASGIGESEWEDFLDDQFDEAAAKSPLRPRPAVAEPDYDSQLGFSPEDILIIPDGGMASLRFAAER